MKRRTSKAPAAEAGPTVTKAILRAANRLGISNKVVGGIIGLSEAIELIGDVMRARRLFPACE